MMVIMERKKERKKYVNIINKSNDDIILKFLHQLF